jgi:hypothetical protein
VGQITADQLLHLLVKDPFVASYGQRENNKEGNDDKNNTDDKILKEQAVQSVIDNMGP